MLKKTITYTDYYDHTRTEDFYFNITESELSMMEMGIDGGFRRKLEIISQKENIPEMIKVIHDLILRAYGEKSPDGRQFVKSEELSRAFEQTEAFNKLFMDLCYDAEEASTFIKGVLPKELDKKMEKYMSKNGNVTPMTPVN